MNFYPHHIGDFNNATRHLTRVEQSVYRDAIELYYDIEQPLQCVDMVVLERRLLCRSDEEKAALQVVLAEFFVLKGVGYTHARCDAEIAKYRAIVSSKAKAGKASALAKQQKSTRVQQPSTCVQRNSTNQEPLTINQYKEKPIVAASPLPDFINPETWEMYKTHRGSKFTTNAKNLIIKDLINAKQLGHNPNAILEKSVANGWKGVFLPKDKPLKSDDDFMRGVT